MSKITLSILLFLFAIVLTAGSLMINNSNKQNNYTICELTKITDETCILNNEHKYIRTIAGLVIINNTIQIANGEDICDHNCVNCECNYIAHHSYYCNTNYNNNISPQSLISITCIKPLDKSLIVFVTGAILIILAIAIMILCFIYLIVNKYNTNYTEIK